MKYKAMIGCITVSSNNPVIVYGSVRGIVSEHRTLSGANKSLSRDQSGCKKQGGYSDARIYEYSEREGWVPSDCSEYSE